MKIRLYSDVHNEISRYFIKDFINWTPSILPDDKDTVLILAGDIDCAKYIPKYLNSLSDRFLAVVHIAGNHEYYKGNITSCNRKMGENLNDNVYHLNNESIIIDGVKIIGGTMWTSLKDPFAEIDAKNFMNDYKKIRHGSISYPWSRKLTPADTTVFHLKWEKFATEELKKSWGGKSIVITHHSPYSPYSRVNGNPPYGGNPKPIDDAYYAYKEGLIMDMKPTLWCFGHTHEVCDEMFDETRIVANCVGYHTENTKYVDKVIVI